MNNLKISVIGTGHLGTIHCKLISQNPNIDFVGVYDISFQKAEEQAKLYNIKAFTSIKEIINSSEAIFIVVPTINHFEIAKQVLSANKHCFIEKPVCSNLEEAEKLLRLEKQHSNLKIQIGHIERFNPAVTIAKNYDIKPDFIEAHRLTQFRPRATDVSVVLDLMIHDIDLILWLAEDNKVCDIDANGVSIITDTIDLANARIKFENGMVANLTASRISAKQMRKFRIFQKHGYFSLDLAKGNVEMFRIVDNFYNNIDNKKLISTQMLGEISDLKDKKIIYENVEIPSVNAMIQEQQSFIDSIVNNKPVACTLTEGTKSLEIAETINNLIKK